MICCTAFSHTPTLNHEGKPGPFSNSELGVMWLDWCAELGGIAETELVILGPANFTLPESVHGWKSVVFLPDREHTTGWPYGPNSAFRQLAWQIFYRKGFTEPWLFCEPDCIPLKRTWLAELAKEYELAGQAFMGTRVTAGKNYPEHMSGNAVYPQDAVRLAPSLVSEKKMNVAWDIRGAKEVLPRMHATDLIVHYFRRPKYESLEELRAEVPPRAVLFHSDKYGAVAQLLRGINQPALAPAPAAEVVAPLASRAVFSLAELCDLISANVKSETARTRLMAYLRDKHFHQKNFGAGLKELAIAER